MRGRSTFLRRLTTADVPWLMDVETGPGSATAWRFRDAEVTLEGYRADVEEYDEAWVVFARADGRRVGFVGVKGFDAYQGTAYVHVINDPEAAGVASRLFEAIALVLTRAFEARPSLRKVYGEVPAFLWPAYRSGVDNLFQLEGRLTQHVRRGDELFDLWVIAFLRERWLEQFEEMRELVAP